MSMKAGAGQVIVSWQDPNAYGSPLSSMTLSPPSDCSACKPTELLGMVRLTHHFWMGDGDGPSQAYLSEEGITEPAEPITCQAHATYRVWNDESKFCTTSSAIRLVAPITDEGRTALSVEISTNDSTPNRPDISAISLVANTLFLTASSTFDSIIGTCLCAAACRTTCGRYVQLRFGLPRMSLTCKQGKVWHLPATHDRRRKGALGPLYGVIVTVASVLYEEPTED